MPLTGSHFCKTNRLNKAEQYNQVFRSRCRSVDKFLIVIASKNSKQDARLGLAISKKAIARAVLRNRLKRLIRESFRQNRSLLAGLDVVVTTNKKLAQYTNKQISGSLEKHWLEVTKCKTC